MSTVGWLHTLCAVLALASGAAVLLRAKGTNAHRRVGWVYVGSMVALNVTALMIYRLFGGFGPFHVLALVSLATLMAGVVPAVRKQPRDSWVERHYFFMTYSYLGLVAAAASEVATRMPGAGGVFWWAVVTASVAVIGVGGALIRRRVAVTLAPFRSGG